MAEGHLLVPTPLDKPIRLIDADVTNTNNWFKEQIRRRNLNILSDGLIDPDTVDGIISNSVNQGYIKMSAIPKGFYQGGYFAKSIAEQEFVVPGGDKTYFVYVLAKETDTVVTYQEDEFTPDHTYRDYTPDLLFSETEDSNLGVRLGTIIQSGTSIAIIDTTRKISQFDFEHISGQPGPGVELLPAFESSQFEKNQNDKIAIQIPILQPIGSLMPWHKNFGEKSNGTNDSLATNKLIDGAAVFQTAGVTVDMIVYNQTDMTWSYVISVAETELVLNDDIFTTTGKSYYVYAVPKLSPEWAECNGQVLADPDSPFDGQTIPNLNSDARFLRGSATSGIDQNATEVAVTVETDGTTLYFDDSGVNMSTHNKDFDTVTTQTTTRGAINKDDSYANVQTSSGTVRPVNMSVVWIIRIK